MINSSDTSQYDNLIFIGSPAIPTRMNMYKLSLLLNTGTTPTIINNDKTQSRRVNHDWFTRKPTDNIAGKTPNAIWIIFVLLFTETKKLPP